MSATQAEYMAAPEAAMEAIWIRKFVGDLGVMPSIKKPIDMYCDNSAAIIFANDSGVMKGAKHFLWRYHYVREQVESGEIKILKVHTDDNLADPFTKALPRGKVTDLANGIGLQLASSFMHTCDYRSTKDHGFGKTFPASDRLYHHDIKVTKCRSDGISSESVTKRLMVVVVAKCSTIPEGQPIGNYDAKQYHLHQIVGRTKKQHGPALPLEQVTTTRIGEITLDSRTPDQLKMMVFGRNN
ncbi:hypothetical protein Tco_0777505 [Tanacetum coccineum]